MTSSHPAVEDDRGTLSGRVAHRLGHEGGRERQERDRHQQQQIDLHHPAVCKLDASEHSLVHEPDSTDREEARDIA